ncbi:2045_t:CDS:2, partial [Paraglomus occultum]
RIIRNDKGDNHTAEPVTHFGFREVPEKEKENLVGQVFANVASKYDLMNDLMSLGVHRLWKNYFINSLAPGPDTKLIDVAGGSGDIAISFLKYCHKTYASPSPHVTVVDINQSMLSVASSRLESLPYPKAEYDLLLSNAESLSSVPSDSFDAYTIAFGIRNCTHISRVLSEAYRVLKPGGRFMCLEFAPKQSLAIIEKLYDIYSFDVIPVIGQVIAQDRDSYQYLVESIRRFPQQEQLAEMVKKAGFVVMGKGWTDLSFGVSAIHEGFKI